MSEEINRKKHRYHMADEKIQIHEHARSSALPNCLVTNEETYFSATRQLKVENIQVVYLDTLIKNV